MPLIPVSSGGSPSECVSVATVNRVLALLLASQARADVMTPWSLTANATQAQQLAPRNPNRVSLSVVVPTGSDAFIGDNNRIVALSTLGTQGFRIINGSTWIFGPEYIGPVFVLMASGSATIYALELSAS